ncbi:MAG: hypothetical protein RMI78_05570 [Nitrososphaerota archaeon]|nr:hypothetical protein [Nitrososphaerota archaeon]
MRLQKKASKKPSIGRVLAKYSKREKKRVGDFVHELTTSLTEQFREYIHGFEDLGNSPSGPLNFIDLVIASSVYYKMTYTSLQVSCLQTVFIKLYLKVFRLLDWE